MEILKNLNLEEQDLFVPMGDCKPTFWLKNFELRFCAFPFDQLSEYDLKTVIKLFENNFKDMLIDIDISAKSTQKNNIHLNAKDNQFDYKAIHHFHKNYPIETQTKTLNQKMKKRGKRLIKFVSVSKKVCFITNFCFDINSFENFIKYIEKRFKNTKFTIINLNNINTEEINLKEYNISNTKLINIDFNNTYQGSEEKFSWIGNEEINKQIFSKLKRNKKTFLLALHRFIYFKTKSIEKTLNTLFHKLSCYLIPQKKKHITAIMCVKNEEKYIKGFIEHIYPYIDSIVAVDDGSTDKTVEILKSFDKTKKILELPVHSSKDWNERENRLKVIELAKAINSDWVLCCDPDERFEENFLKKLRILTNTSRKVCYNIHFRELWDKFNQYRADGIWDTKSKGILFPLSQNMTFNYRHNHHISWHYSEIEEIIPLDYNLYHFKMIKEEDRKERQNLYKEIDPNNEMQSRGYDYLTEEKNLKLKKISFFKRYNIKTIPNDIKNYQK